MASEFIPRLSAALYLTSGREYREPRPSSDLPRAEKLSVSLNSSRWLVTSFICYACGDWAARHRSSPVQPWIWAFSESQEFENATIQSEVWFHAYTGLFTLDMTDSMDTNASGLPVIPLIDPSIPNQNLANKINTYSTMIPVHGSLLALAMMILYPIGVIIIQGMPSKARWYLVCQTLASISCAIGAASIIYTIFVTGWVCDKKNSSNLAFIYISSADI